MPDDIVGRLKKLRPGIHTYSFKNLIPKKDVAFLVCARKEYLLNRERNFAAGRGRRLASPGNGSLRICGARRALSRFKAFH